MLIGDGDNDVDDEDDEVQEMRLTNLRRREQLGEFAPGAEDDM